MKGMEAEEKETKKKKKGFFALNDFTRIYTESSSEMVQRITSSQNNTDFFKKHASFIAFIICLMFLYMNNRMKLEIQFREINELKRKLEIARYTSMQTEAELLRESRPDKIKVLLQRHNLQLDEMKVPPYRVTK